MTSDAKKADGAALHGRAAVRDEDRPRAPKEKVAPKRTLAADEREARRAAAALARDGRA